MIVTLENEIAKMSQVLENSGLAGRRVQGIFEKVDYEQGKSLATDLNRLKYTEEDHSRFNREVDYSALDEVFPLIEENQADLVHLFVRDGTGACGGASMTAGITILKAKDVLKGAALLKTMLLAIKIRTFQTYQDFARQQL